jgi:hypothetical protein
MKCNRFRFLMYLDRHGELSDREAYKLKQHLAMCEKCSHELTAIRQTEEYIAKLRRLAPTPTNPDLLTDRIMAEVDKKIQNKPNHFFRSLDVFTLPRVQIASVVIITMVIALFGGQYFSLMYNVKRLEQSIAQRSQESLNFDITYSIESKTIKQNADLQKLQKMYPTVEQSLTDGNITIKRRELIPLLDKLDQPAYQIAIVRVYPDFDMQRIRTIIAFITNNAKIKLSFEKERE